MAANVAPIFVKNPSAGTPAVFAAADTTTKKSLYTAGAEGARLDAIYCSSNDTAAINLEFHITIGGTDYYIGVVNIPISAGYGAVVKVDAVTTLAPLLAYLVLPASGILKANCLVTMTAAKVCTVVPQGGDY